MSTVYDPPAPAGSEQAPAPHPYPWPGPGGPSGPGGPPGYGYGGGGEGPGRPLRRPRRYILAAAAVAAVALAAFWGAHATGATPDVVLTTSQIAARTDPGLADIVSTLGYQDGTASGTGLVLTSSGQVLTNNHVIAGATSITVTDVGNGRSYRAAVVGYDQGHDIAVLRLRDASGLKTVTLGDSSTAAAGQQVVALGNAGGKGGTPSVATGRITGLGTSVTALDQGSSTSETLTGLIRSSAGIQPGDSGGPLVNRFGQVIGINTAAGQAPRATQAFAIPVDQAVSIASQITAGTSSATVHIGATGFLGVQILSPARAAADGGAAVAGVVPGSPAAAAGLAAGDVITRVGGHPIPAPSAVQSALRADHPGDRVSIGWTDRAGQARSATLVLTTGPAA